MVNSKKVPEGFHVTIEVAGHQFFHTCPDRAQAKLAYEDVIKTRLTAAWLHHGMPWDRGAEIYSYVCEHLQKANKQMPDFKSHDDRDKYFADNADYFTCVRKVGVGNYERSEHNSLAEAVSAAQAKVVVTGGRYMIYAVIGEQSALSTTVG